MAQKRKPTEQYTKEQRWGAKNLKRYNFAVNLNTDKDLADFLDREAIVGRSDILRLGVQMVRLMTDDLLVLTTYKADNGDEFVRIVRHDLPQPNTKRGVVKCMAVLQTRPVKHLSYYTEDGEFIATAGTHIHTRLGVMTEFLYTKRVSDKTQNDTITEALGYQE